MSHSVLDYEKQNQRNQPPSPQAGGSSCFRSDGSQQRNESMFGRLMQTLPVVVPFKLKYVLRFKLTARATCDEQRAESREQRAESREQRAESREQRAGVSGKRLSARAAP
ncbi:hypothetical protein EYF80_059503 [Liparis tanakae]|uniref:Uncharacterized protein n=1 Tax=Liparis tanakae TaxID=230148 RepID=A0A4Z2EN76_9TELE|nr:hypothetical protein EYF80_059503 [Liparis tanakae]